MRAASVSGVSSGRATVSIIEHRDGLPEARLAPSPGLDRLVAAGLLERAGGRLRPTPRGLLFADEIGAVLLE